MTRKQYLVLLSSPNCSISKITNTNKNTKVRSVKSSQNSQKKECGSDCTVSNNKFSSVTLNELAMKARESIQ